MGPGPSQIGDKFKLVLELCPRHDIFAYNPSYEWTSHKTRVGMVLSYLTIAFSNRSFEYFCRPNVEVQSNIFMQGTALRWLATLTRN